MMTTNWLSQDDDGNVVNVNVIVVEQDRGGGANSRQ
jgi:hypothetical protein